MHGTDPIHGPALRLRGTLRLDEPMKKHVTWRAGGAAAVAYVPPDEADLSNFLSGLPREKPVCFVGLGSNLLVRDGGFRGVVVLMHDTRGTIRFDGSLVFAQAGVASPKVARFAATHALEGAEFLAGVPGTVGGALAMNAGCYGSETWDFVERARTIRRSGEIRELARADFTVGYRHVALKDAVLGENEWFTAAWLRFRRGDAAKARARIRELLSLRIATQPLNLPNAGSVFRNPPGEHAARLIDACGLKGFAIGGARISEMHANFIVNQGGRGSAADIEALIGYVRGRVMERFGVELIPEVRIVGEAG